MNDVTRVVVYQNEAAATCPRVDQYLLQGYLIREVSNIRANQEVSVTRYILEKRERGMNLAPAR